MANASVSRVVGERWPRDGNDTDGRARQVRTERGRSSTASSRIVHLGGRSWATARPASASTARRWAQRRIVDRAARVHGPAHSGRGRGRARARGEMRYVYRYIQYTYYIAIARDRGRFPRGTIR
jgi:hypothetical protein